MGVFKFAVLGLLLVGSVFFASAPSAMAAAVKTTVKKATKATTGTKKTTTKKKATTTTAKKKTKVKKTATTAPVTAAAQPISIEADQQATQSVAVKSGAGAAATKTKTAKVKVKKTTTKKVTPAQPAAQPKVSQSLPVDGVTVQVAGTPIGQTAVTADPAPQPSVPVAPDITAVASAPGVQGTASSPSFGLLGLVGSSFMGAVATAGKLLLGM